MNLLIDIVKELTKQHKTVATMESCTGGAIVNEITMISGASEILKFSAITYSNEFKIKMGVDENIIKEYSVYSEETAKDMSKKIAIYADSDFGIGVTGKMNTEDYSNPYGDNDIIFVSIYDRTNDKYLVNKVKAIHNLRKDNKELVVKTFEYMLKSML